MSFNRPTYPGVYTKLAPSEVRTIIGVGTSMTAFVGATSRGPMNDPKIIHSFTEFSDIFGGLSKDSLMGHMVFHYYQNRGTDAIIVRVNDGSLKAEYTLFYPQTPDSYGKFEAASSGESGKEYSVAIEKNKSSATTINLYVKSVVKGAEPSESLIQDWLKSSTTFEAYYKLSPSTQDARFITNVLKSESSLIRVAPDMVGDFKLPHINNNDVLVFTTPLDKKLSGDKVTLEDIYPQSPENIKARKGIYALEGVDLFNLLVIPPYEKDGSDFKDVPKNVKDFVSSYCEKRRAIYIVDPGQKWDDPSEALSGIDSTTFGPTRIKNAAIYFPNIIAADPLQENRLREFPPSGAVAGIIARIDSTRGFWKSPAGLEASLRGVSELSVKLTDNENGELNQKGLNCLRFKPPSGIVSWGARTMMGADELADQYKYLSVIRVALNIEESLYRGTQWVVFEPNDERLWAQIRLNVGSFMHDLFRKGAFQGTSPKEAYLVKCDKETTTQHDINKGIVNIIVGFSPLKPAEFVLITIRQLTGMNNGESGA